MKKKVLLLHNYYGSGAPSGENSVFEAEASILRKHGHEVSVFCRRSDTIRGQGKWGEIKGALSTPWNPLAAKAVRQRVADFRPDIVHVHNTFPLLSPAIFHAIGNRAARVMTVHNYRIFCAAGIPMRKGMICTLCMENRSALSALKHGCYRNSYAATIPMVASISLHRLLGTWQREVEAFIALSDFQAKQLISAGLPRDRVLVKPNFYSGTAVYEAWDDRPDRVVFVGRVSAEKGIVDLVTAWRSWGTGAPELVVIGDGPLKETLESDTGVGNVRFLGQIPKEEARRWIASSKLLVLPSTWFETFGLVLIEAFAHATPVAVSNLGSLPHLVRHGKIGAIFRPDDPSNLLKVVSDLWLDEARMRSMSRYARQEFEKKYTEEVNYEMLMDVYERAIAISRV